jgi:NitT/TauT family transport system substrate-binding protein
VSSRVGRALAALGLVCVIGAAASSGAAAPNRTERANAINVRVTVFPAAIPSLGVYIADAMGFFEKNNINISYVNVGTGSSAIQALVSGSTDFTISDVTGVTLARRNTGADVRFVSGQFSRFMGALQCRPGSGVTGAYPAVMKRLEGKKIGITAPGSSTDTYVRYSMIEAGADPAKATIIGIGGVPNLVAAIQAGSVDCITSYQPIQRLVAGKVDTVVNWATGQGPQVFAKDYSYNGMVTTNGYAKNNPGAARLFANAMREATTFGADPKNAATIAARTVKFFPGLDVATLTGIIEDTAPTLGYTVTRKNVANAVKVFNTINPTAKIDYPYTSYVVSSVLDLTGPTVKLSKTRKGNSVTVSWKGTDVPGARDVTDVSSGVKNYDLATRVGNGAWRTRIAGSSATSFKLNVKQGEKAQVRVRARDKAGNTGRWAQVSV